MPSAETAELARAPQLATAGLVTCTQLAAPTQLAADAWPNVQPHIKVEPDSGTLGVGFASGPRTAIGLSAPAGTLEVEQVFREERAQYLTSVVPLLRAGSLGFGTARFLVPLSQSTLVDGPAPFTLGLTQDGVAVVYTKGGGTLHWPLKNSKSTSVVQATSSEAGHSVVLRVIGRPSAIRYGRLNPDGSKQTELFTLSQGSVADPAVAMRSGDAVLAFATRMQDESWSLVLSIAHNDAAPEKPTNFELPEGGPGAGARLPSLAAFGDAGYILQWVEGLPKGVARAQLINAELKPVGKPLLLSHPNHVVRSAVLATHGQRLFSVYTEGAGVRRALWATSFECR